MTPSYKAEIWQGGSGVWYVNDVRELNSDQSAWWMPARILGITPADFILLLKNEFNVSTLKFDTRTNFLLYSWDNYSDANRYKLYINKIARTR